MSQPRTTDWDRYYCRPYCTAGLTRRHTGRVLLKAIQAHAHRQPERGLVIAELGGANSCFYSLLTSQLKPGAYHVIDQHRHGLDLLWQRRAGGVETVLHEADILDIPTGIKADVVFSVGLVEHFNPQDVARAVAAHFSLAAPGGLVIMTFPTPTWLYKMARRVSESLGLWIFHDERPLALEEVARAVEPWGRIVQTGLIWPIVFTQALLAAEPQAGPAERRTRPS